MGESPGDFSRQSLIVGLDFHAFPYFVYIVHFTKFTRGISLEKSLLVEKSKVEGTKKKKKKQERKYHFVKKRKENLLRKRLVLAELHAGIQISNREVAVKPKIAIHDVENEVSFFCMQVPASTKILTIYISSNRNFESCMTIRCLAPQHIFRFSIFAVGFSFAFGNFANYCIVLLNAL